MPVFKLCPGKYLFKTAWISIDKKRQLSFVGLSISAKKLTVCTRKNPTFEKPAGCSVCPSSPAYLFINEQIAQLKSIFHVQITKTNRERKIQTATKQIREHNGEKNEIQRVRIQFFDMPVPAHTFPAKKKPPAAGSPLIGVVIRHGVFSSQKNFIFSVLYVA